MGSINVLGIDLAKRVFQVHGVDQAGEAVLRKAFTRTKFEKFITELPPCIVGLEAGGSSHYWARRLISLGHSVRMIAPQFVKPFVKSNKTDAADAEAIVEAIQRPGMRFVRPKENWQSELQALHRIRSSLITERTGVLNALYALLYEQGIVATKQEKKLCEEAAHLRDSRNTGTHLRLAIETLLNRLCRIEELLAPIDQELSRFSRVNEECLRLQSVPGVGVISATAIVSSVGDVSHFKSARQFAASLGLVPKQSSSGGKQNLLGISKRGDAYLRTLLIHGARSVLRHAPKHPEDRIAAWAIQKIKTRGQARATVAVANKNARVIWALLTRKEDYKGLKSIAA